MGRKKLNPECFSDMNHFSGILPQQHNEVGCHNVSQHRRRILCEMKALVRDLNSIPKCNEWDSSLTSNDTDGPFRFGEFQQRNGKPWELPRVKSSELVGSQLTPACICLKRNGLQDDCRMLECRGRDWCLTEPWPQCPPFTKEPKQYYEPNPLEMCPGVREGKVIAGNGGNGGGVGNGGNGRNGGNGGNGGNKVNGPGSRICYAPQQFYVGNDGCCYMLEQLNNPCCSQMQNTYMMQPC